MTTTTLELKNPINVAGGKEGGKTIESLEVAPLQAGHLWDTPAADLGARDTLSVGVRMAGMTGKMTTKVARELAGPDIKALTILVNAAIQEFQDGAQSATREGVDADEAHTIELRDPLTIAGEALSQLTLKPLRGKDVWDVPSSGVTFGHLFGVGASQCGQADGILKKLSAWDAGQLVGVTNAFLTDFRGTGE